MTVSKIRLNGTDHDIRAKYLIQSTSADVVSAEFSARTVTEDAIANIQKIYGNTVKWNQLIQNGNFASGTSDWSVIAQASSVSDGVISLTTPNSSGLLMSQSYAGTANHIYYGAASVKATSSSIYFRVGNVPVYHTGSGSFERLSTLYSKSASSSNVNPQFRDMRSSSYDAVMVKDVILVDLTAIYGSGNEPTAAEFEAQYPALYYSYDTGSLTSNSATAILSRGFNQWDEEWTRGNINDNTGVVTIDTASGTMLLSKNRIHVLPNTTYCLHYGKTGSNARVYYYTSLTGSYINKTGWIADNATFITPSDCTALLFKVSVSVYGSVYNNDICINISDPSKNGTYEPYNGHQIDLNIPTLTGKLNGAGSSVVIFPDGMGYDGENRDELTLPTALKKTGCVDLGDLTWSALANNPGKFYAQVSGVKASTKNIMCAKYSNASAWNSISDKQGAITSPSFGATDRYFIYDTDFSSYSAAQVKTALSGVSLVYELATSEEYILDNALQLQYPVVAGGTEMVLPTVGTAPMKMDVIYGNAADAAATMSQNFISVDSMKNFLSALGTQMNGTWAMQYSGGKYTFTFTSN